MPTLVSSVSENVEVIMEHRVETEEKLDTTVLASTSHVDM